MNLNFNHGTGAITDDDGNSITNAAWSGNHEGKLNPAMQNVVKVGPIPCGVFKVLKPWGDNPPHGPDSVQLEQVSGETYGRSGFMVHGPSQTNYGQESEGCIVIPHDPRIAIMNLDPDTITVT